MAEDEKGIYSWGIKVLFSIIIPVYNAEKYLHQCIDSVLKQTYERLELILIDDGSQDGSGQICDQYAKNDSRVHVIHKQNEGVVLARQEGTAAAKGDYLVFVDADDLISRTSLEQINIVLETYEPDIVAYGAQVETRTGRIKRQSLSGAGMYCKRAIERNIFPYLIQTDTCKYFPPCLVTKAFRSQLYKAHLCTDREIVIGEDAAGSIACMFHADSLFVMNECLYYYRFNKKSVTRSGRAYSWRCAERIAEFLKREIDLSIGDLEDQLLRYVVHMLFITACSQFQGGGDYKQITASIHKNINDPFYASAIKKCRFRFLSKGWLARLALQHELYPAMKLWSLIH